MDDPLYIPSYRRVKAILGQEGLLVVRDSKMRALSTLATIVAGQDHYLTPLTEQQEEAVQLAELIAPWQGREEKAMWVYLTADGAGKKQSGYKTEWI